MRWGRQGLAGWAAALVLAACGAPEGEPPAAAARAALSEAGLYRVSLEPEDGRIPLGTIHAWVVAVEGAAGEPVVPTRLAVGGGMPQHGHGFVTAPRVTRALGGGRYRVEGMKFHMGGDWTLRVEVVAPPGPDVAVFHVKVDG